MLQQHLFRPRCGHTLMEMMAAMVAASVLMAGLASVMLIGRQIAFTPSAPAHRLDAARLVNEIASDLRFATHIIEQSPYVLDFVVPDRDGDGAAERFRYQWSGAPGDALLRSKNGAPLTSALDSIQEFQVTPSLRPSSTTLTPSTYTNETLLAGNTAVNGTISHAISSTQFTAQHIDPQTFPSVPSNALSWCATRAEFFGRRDNQATGTFRVEMREVGDPSSAPTSLAAGSVDVLESALSTTLNWITAVFPTPITDLRLHRKYALTFVGTGTNDGMILEFAATWIGLFESEDAGASWYFPGRQMYYRLYGKYQVPGTSHNLVRQYIQHVKILLRAGEQPHSRIDARVPLINEPELLSKYWRTDFDDDPTMIDVNGDAMPDWELAGAAEFDGSSLTDGTWLTSGALETRPLDDFSGNTTIEVSCRNVTQGGNGAVIRINADRQSGTHAPIFATLQLKSDNTQTLTLYGKSADATNVQLFARQKLPNDFIRIRLTILPAGDVVNLQINDEDQGSFIYPTYSPTSNDRFLTIFADTSIAQFDYAEVRIATP